VVKCCSGGTVIREHDERPSGHQELYLVTAGHATFRVGGEEFDAPQGTILFVRDPAATRGAVAIEPATTVLAVGGRPGAAYRPLADEALHDADLAPLSNDPRFAEAIRAS
jgi:hypothetical protein